MHDSRIMIQEPYRSHTGGGSTKAHQSVVLVAGVSSRTGGEDAEFSKTECKELSRANVHE